MEHHIINTMYGLILVDRISNDVLRKRVGSAVKT